jgi:hypothetical protein
MTVNSVVENLAQLRVSDEHQEHRHALVLANTHAQVAPIPAYAASNGLNYPSVGWSGSGGNQFTLAAGNTVRLVPNPWNVANPIAARVLPTGTIGTTVASSVNSGAGQVPVGTEFNDEYVSGPGAVGSIVNIQYTNINQTDSGFPTSAPNDMDPVAQFAGGHMIVTVVCAENTSATVVAIGQNEVRGVGIGPYTEETMQQFQYGMQPSLPDYDNDESLYTPYGEMQRFKEPSMVVGTTNLSTKVVSVPIKPSHGNWYCMMNDEPALNEDASFIQIVSATVHAKDGGGFDRFNDANEVGNSASTSIVKAGTYVNLNQSSTFVSRGNPFFTIGDPTDTSENTWHPKGSGYMRYLDANTLLNTAPTSGLVTDADRSLASWIAPITNVDASTILRSRRNRPRRSVNAGIRDGMPIVEIKGLTGVVNIQVHFKMHYNIAVTNASAHYERAIMPLNLHMNHLLNHVSTHAGVGSTVEEAIKNSLMQAANSTKKPKITHTMIDAGSKITGGALVMYTPKSGVKEPVHHEEETHQSFAEKLLGGMKSGLSYIGSGASWLWEHKGDVSRIGGGAISAIAAARQAGASSPYALIGAGAAGAMSSMTGGQQPSSYAQVARRAIGQRYPRIEELE